MRWWIGLNLLVLSLFAQTAEANCKVFNVGYSKQFKCPDGSVQSIELIKEQLIVRTFNPETKSWSEQRFAVAPEMTLDNVNISVMMNANHE